MNLETFAIVATGLLTANSALATNSSLVKSQTDASGKITTAVFMREASSAQSHFKNFSVEVPDGFVVVGGGVEGARVPYGHLITGSKPNESLTSWQVSTKDHEYAHPHKIKAYAIGMKVKGLNRSQLRNFIKVRKATDIGSHPSAAAGVFHDYQLIGGGFKANWNRYGSLGTANFPENAYSWKGAAKDHSYSDPSELEVWSIGIKNYIQGVGNIDVSIQHADSSDTSHPASSANVAPGFALTSCGAEVHWNGAGNLLWKIVPKTSLSDHGCSAGSKDHVISSPASITTYALGIRAY